ncbi:hypothetical protein AAFF_G00096820 [Aldrovandia affinis]|uniref:Uncharacterized protein n=1 Tax=Aldrovandia affinis TaxID=143900 RepID=A0AAD7WBI9_9TELE|nr:hypothetical protein AAFF_G00096820 [Aldrovandia affinis]
MITNRSCHLRNLKCPYLKKTTMCGSIQSVLKGCVFGGRGDRGGGREVDCCVLFVGCTERRLVVGSAAVELWCGGEHRGESQ